MKSNSLGIFGIILVLIAIARPAAMPSVFADILVLAGLVLGIIEMFTR